MDQTKKEELDYIASQLKPVIMDMLKSYSIGVGQIELATSLNGVNSLPALMRVGGVDKVVEVPISLIMTGAEVAGLAELTAKTEQLIEKTDALSKQVTDVTPQIEDNRSRIDSLSTLVTEQGQLLAQLQQRIADCETNCSRIHADIYEQIELINTRLLIVEKKSAVISLYLTNQSGNTLSDNNSNNLIV